MSRSLPALPLLFALLALVIVGCEPPAEPPEPTVALAQTAADLEAGDPLTLEAIDVLEVPTADAPEEGLRGADVSRYMGRILAEDLEAGTVLTSDHFEPPPEPLAPAAQEPSLPEREVDPEVCDPQQEEIEAAIAALDRSCEFHIECVLYRPACPFGCGESIRHDADTSELRRAIRSFRSDCELCRTDCRAPGFPVCHDGQCSFGTREERIAEEQEMEAELLREIGAQVDMDDPMVRELLQQLQQGQFMGR
jgi:hypothetical protein